MYDHIGIKVKDLAASVRFYEAALAPLGHVLGSKDESGAGLGPKDASALWLSAGKPPNGAAIHIAFSAPDRAAVDAFYKKGLTAGGTENGAAGLRPDYGPNYYAAFLIDPDGNNVEAVCNE